MYDIIIIGAGPAGLTAAIYASRANKKVLVLEAKNYGGQIINTNDIENYPGIEHISGFDYATNLYNQVKSLGVEVVFEKATNIKLANNIKIVETTDHSYETQTINIATGADNRKLGIDNEDKFIGKGISYCATCDGNFYKTKDVAVVGGGNTAIEDAEYLSDIVNKVYLIHRRDEFRADNSTVSKLQKRNNVEFILNSTVTKLNGENFIESIEVTDKDNNKKTIDVNCLFIAIGKIPENENFKEIIDMDDKGYIISAENCHTNIDGIFVAGDNRVKQLRQLVTATSDGAVAATEAIKYLNK